MRRTIFLLLISVACAHEGQLERRRDEAVLIKSTADGLGSSYLGYCETVRRPACIAADKKAREAGKSPTQDERVMCLRPCDSATAETIQVAVDELRSAQTVMWLLLTRGDATTEELMAARIQLLRSGQRLLDLLQQTGAVQALKDAVGDP
jgi:hypothetical protein